MQEILSDVIKQIYDPFAGHEIIKGEPYTPKPDDIPHGAVEATIEYLGEHGFIACPLYAVLSEELYSMPQVQEKGLTGVKFKQQIDGKWELQIQGNNGICELCFALNTEQLLAVFTRDNIVLYSYSEALIVSDDAQKEEEQAQPPDEEVIKTAQEPTNNGVIGFTAQDITSPPEQEDTEEYEEEIFEDENTVLEPISEQDESDYSGDWQDHAE